MNGLDSRSTVEAQSASTPWKSINHALHAVQSGNRINVAPGTYAESAQTAFANVTLRATGAANAVTIAPPSGQVGLVVIHPGMQIEGFVILGGTHGIKATGADGIRIRGCKAVGQTFNGFTIEQTSGATVDSSIAASAGSRGIFLDHTSEAYVRNNLVYAAGEWGVDFDNTNASDPQPPLSMGNVVAFNTIASNGDAAGEGGLRLKNAVGQIRDNVITANATTGLRLDTAGSVVKNNLLFGSANPVSPDTYVLGGGMIAADPLLVDPDGADGVLGGIAGWADDVFALGQVASGQGADSPAVDAGSGNASALDIGGSTRTDAAADTGVADLGFHAGAPASTGVPPVTSGPATYYVNATTGSDARNKIQAQSALTPWQTIGRALSATGAASNDTIRVSSGTYAEAVTTSTGGITLRATGTAIIAPPAGIGMTVNHPGVLIEGFTFQGGLQAIKASGADGLTVRECTTTAQTGTAISVSDSDGVVIDGNAIDAPAGRGILAERSTDVHVTNNAVTDAGEWAIQLDATGLAAMSTGNEVSGNTVTDPGQVNPAGAIDLVYSTGVAIGNATTGGQHGIRAALADDLIVRGSTITGPGSNGIYVIDTSGVLIDDNVIRTAGARGIYLERTGEAYVRNNLVAGCGEWGIQLNSATGAVALANEVAFNTVVGNGVSPSSTDGGIRFQNALGQIRDNVVASNDSKGIKVDKSVSIHHNDVVGSATPYEDQSSDAPSYAANLAVDPLFADANAGDYRLQTGSPVIDHGSGLVTLRDISGATRADGVPDTGIADMGRHVGATASSGSPPGPDPTPTPTPGPTPTPRPGEGTVHYVDCASGDDARTKAQAQNPATPWRTIQKAASTIQFGEVAVVANGTCEVTAEIEVDKDGLTLRAATPRGTTVRRTSGTGNVFNVQKNDVTLEGFVVESPTRGVLAARSNANEDITNLVLRGLLVQPVAASMTTDGIQVRDGLNVTVEDTVVRGANGQGIVLKRVVNAYVRNNLVHGCGDWGISLDNTDAAGAATPPVSTGNIAAFNTVYGNNRGLRFVNSSGEIRDNVVVSNASVGIKFDIGGLETLVHHNDAFGQTQNYVVPNGFQLWASNRSVDPLFVAPASFDFALSQVAAGQAAQSPLVDEGSAPVAESDISGTTQSGNAPLDDTGIADMGFHSDASSSTTPPGGPSPTPTPSVSTVWVDCVAGDDSASAWEAQFPWSAWKTIGNAMAQVASGGTVVVRSGECAESVTVATAAVTLRAEVRGDTTIRPPAGAAGITVRGDSVVVDGFVVRSDKEGILVAKESSGQKLQDAVIRQNRVKSRVANGTIATNGIRVRNGQNVTLDGNVVTDAVQSGIVLRQGTTNYVRNNLVLGSGEWGIHVDNGDGIAMSTGNVVAFNTVHDNGTTASQGGIRFSNATGEIRDNLTVASSGPGIKTDTQPTYVHHNGIFGNPVPIESDVAAPPAVWANVEQDPLFAALGVGGFQLQQLAAGQSAESPMVDSGSGEPATRDISGSTRTDGLPDDGIADIGYHAGAAASTGKPAIQDPPTGDPTPGSGFTYYVDPVSGANTRTLVEARSQATPWKTISFAMTKVSAGDVISLAPGTYAEQADFSANALTLRGQGSLGGVVIAPPTGSAGVNVDGFHDARIENLLVQGGAQGVTAAMADGIRVTGIAVVSPATVGIRVRQTNGARIDNSIVTGAANYGILLPRTSNAYVRNNLVYANPGWGISVDSDGSPTSTGNVIAFNTVHQNGNGLRLLNASGDIRDNNFTETVDLALYLAGPNLSAHHNNFSANGRDRDKASAFADSIVVWSNVGKNPRYEEPAGLDGILGGSGWADDDFRLEQLAAGGEFESPVVNAGSGQVAALDIGGSTRKDAVADTGVADIGYHYGAPAAVAPPTPQTPPTTFTWTYYVSPGGDDTNSDATARNLATPWKTITKALQRINAGDTIVVLPGTYAESLQIQDADATLMAQTSGTVTITPPTNTQKGISIAATGVTVDGFVVRGASTGISAEADASSVTVRNCAVIGATMDAFRAFSLDGAVFENDVAAGAGGAGFVLRKATNVTVRNNLAYDNGEWGIHIDNTPVGSESVPVSTGNLVAQNTTAFNTTGNVRLANAIGDVRDNVIANTAGIGLAITTAGATLVQNGFFAANTLLDPPSYLFCSGCTGNVVRDPRFVDPDGIDNARAGDGWADDDFRLSQTAAGQGTQSEAVDFGSDTVSVLGITGSTATNGAADGGTADLGFHYSASSRALPAPPPPGSTPTPSPTPTHTPTTTPTPSPTPTRTPSTTPTPSPTPIVTSTPSPTPTASPTPVATPSNGPTPVATTLYIDASLGNDAHTRAQASSPTTPWKTIGHAVSQAAAGDTLLVAAGDYPETASLVFNTAGVALIGQGSDPSAVRVTMPATADALRVKSTGVHVENLWIDGGKRGVLALNGADALQLQDVTVTNTAAEGVAIEVSDDVAIRGCIVTGAASTGIATRRAQRLEIRDTDVYANQGSGLFIRKGDAELSFLTVHANVGRGIRSLGANVHLHDSIVSSNGGAAVFVRGAKPFALDHMLLFGNTADVNDDTPPVVVQSGPAPLAGDPLYVDPDGSQGGGDGILGGAGWADDDLSLKQPPAQGVTSPAVDAGSGTVAALGVTGSTSSNGAADAGVADLGAHR